MATEIIAETTDEESIQLYKTVINVIRNKIIFQK